MKKELFENVFKLSEMARASAMNIRSFIEENPRVLEVYNDPSHTKPGTPENKEWHDLIEKYYELFPEDADANPNKSAAKSFSDSIFNIARKLNAAKNIGKTDDQIKAEKAGNMISKALEILSETELSTSEAYKAIEKAIEEIEAFCVVKEEPKVEDEEASEEEINELDLNDMMEDEE